MALFAMIPYSVHECDSTQIRVDCYPDPSPSEEKCKARGCLWTPSSVPNAPWCFFDPTNSPGYDVTHIYPADQNGFTAIMTRRNTPTMYGNDYNTVELQVKYLTDTTLDISLKNNFLTTENDSMRYYKEEMPKLKNTYDSSTAQYTVTVQQKPFGIAVSRKSTGAVIFDTRNMPGFVMEEQFLSITTKPPNSNIYGFGENTHQNLKHDMSWYKWPMFGRDQPVTGSRMNLYGVHPFYLNVENDGKSNGVLLLNSHAQYVELAPYPTITYRTVGGVLDFKIFLADNPEKVVQQYINTIGLPMMPIYWSLGFHICRYGYHNAEKIQQVIQRTLKAGIPQDGQWADIDYMINYRDFTYNTQNFAQLPQIAQQLHGMNKKMVLILDPCVTDKAQKDLALTTGLKADIFIKDSAGKNLEAKVWPGQCYFPDFTNSNAQAWWTNLVTTFHKSVNVDGLWIDMNEPANFVAGSTSGCPQNQYNNPKFSGLPYTSYLPEKTICMDAQQAWGKHYDIHSMYGYTQARVTNNALKSLFPGKRPFVLTRSTYLGSGQYASHWTGDNNSQFIQMQWSIITILEFQMFGIPHVGADICGFMGNTNEEMCTRWHQLGAFYPFSRNHNNKGSKEQDPAVWSAQSIASTKNALMTRYKLLPHLYTLFHYAHTTGSTGQEVAGANSGRSTTLNIDKWSIGVYARGGHVIPWQTPAITTTDSRKNSMGLLVSLDTKQYATGSLFWDDGESFETQQSGAFLLLYFNATLQGTTGTLSIQRMINGYRGSDRLYFEEIDIYGIKAQPSRVTVNGATVQSSNVNYQSSNNTLVLTQLGIAVSSAFTPMQTVQWYF